MRRNSRDYERSTKTSIETIIQNNIKKVPVHFVDELNNETIDDQTLTYGETPTVPTAPTHEGYTFKGLDKTINPATQETTYTALYEKIKVPVHFVDGINDKPIEDKNVDYCDAPTTPVLPVHEGYEFKALDKTIDPATKEATYTAVY